MNRTYVSVTVIWHSLEGEQLVNQEIEAEGSSCYF